MIRSCTFGIRVNLLLTATPTSLGLCDGCALVILDGKIHQSGGPSGKGSAPPLFLCCFGGGSLPDVGAPGLADRMCRGWGPGLPPCIRPRIGPGSLIGAPAF